MIDGNELRKEVNKLDKEFHIKLKKPHNTDVNKQILMISNKIDQNLLSLIAIINKIDMRNCHANVIKSSYIVSKHIMFLMLCKSSLWYGYNLS